MGGHRSDSDSDSGDERKHHKHDKHKCHDKHDHHDHHDHHHREDRYEEPGHYGSGSHVPPPIHHDVIPGHDHYQGKLRKEDIHDLKNRRDISDEERAHRKKILMAEVAGGVLGAGALAFAGYEAYQHFHKSSDPNAPQKTQPNAPQPTQPNAPQRTQ